MESKIVYFETEGSKNTDEVLRIARMRGTELRINTILVASSTGQTGAKAVKALTGFRVIVVSHSVGFHEPGEQTFTRANREIVESKGGTVLTTSHAFAGVGRAMKEKFNTLAFGDIVANVLRIFGQGMKVSCEISMMAADCGLVSCDEDVISIAGSDHGADTAIVVTPVNSHRFFDLKVKEILCKPRF